MLGFIKKNWKILLILSLFPIIFIVILKGCVRYLPGEMIGTIDGWLGFLGGYFGVLGAVGAVLYDRYLKNIEEKNKYKNCLKYLLKIIEENIKLVKNNQVLKSITFNLIFSKKEEILDFVGFDKSIIDKYRLDFIENNHSCILELDDSLEKFKEKIPIYLNDSIIKTELFLPFFKNEKNIMNFSKEEEEIFHNFINISSFLIRNFSYYGEGYLPILYYYNKNILKKDCILIKELKNVKFKNYTANHLIEEKFFSAETCEDLFFKYYNEIVKVFNIRPIFEDKKKSEIYKEYLIKIIGLYSNDKEKKSMLFKYEKNLEKCRDTISKYLNQ